MRAHSVCSFGRIFFSWVWFFIYVELKHPNSDIDGTDAGGELGLQRDMMPRQRR